MGEGADDHVGLCVACRHAQPLQSPRGSVFWRCAANGLPRYPRLPVVSCPGHALSSVTDPLGDAPGER